MDRNVQINTQRLPERQNKRHRNDNKRGNTGEGVQEEPREQMTTRIKKMRGKKISFRFTQLMCLSSPITKGPPLPSITVSDFSRSSLSLVPVGWRVETGDSIVTIGAVCYKNTGERLAPMSLSY